MSGRSSEADRLFWGFENNPPSEIATMISKVGTMGVAPHAMVAACHNLSAQIGADVLRAGGSAADAFVATTFNDWVVNPGASSFAGPLGAMIYDAKHGVTASLFGGMKNVSSPSGRWSPRDAAVGKLVMVPGAVPALEALHQRYGRLSWSDCLQPSIDTAEHGFIVPTLYANLVKSRASLLETSAYARTTLLRGGQPVAAGTLLRFPLVAETLRHIARDGAAYVQHGAWAHEAVATVRAAGGAMTLADLADYRPMWTQPLHGEYRGYRIAAPGAPDTGGARLFMAMLALAQFDIVRLGHWSKHASSLELMTKIFRGIMAQTWLDDHATMSDPERVAALVVSSSRAIAANVAAPEIPRLTTFGHHSYHVIAVDADGLVVSGTHTIESLPWGNIALFVGGIPLNGSASINLATPPGGYELAPLTASIVTRNGTFVAASGAFSSSLFPADYQVLSNLLDFNMLPEEALLSPRFGYFAIDLAKLTIDTHRIMLDPRYPQKLVAEVAAATGIGFDQGPGYVDIGMPVLVTRDERTGVLRGMTPEVLPEGAALGF